MSTFDEIRRRANAMAQSVSEHTGLTLTQVVKVISYAKRLSHPDAPEIIDERVFVAQLGMRFGITSSFYIQLIFEAIKVRSTKHVKLEDYVRMICIFCCSRLNVKVDFVFNVYDFQRDGHIDHAEMYKLLESSVVVSTDDDPTHQVKELIDIVISLVDTNNDGKISIEEFRRFVGRDILCLELFGQVLPSRKEMDGFMEVLKSKTPKAIRDFFRNERSTCLYEPDIQREKEALYRVSLDIP